VKLVLDNKVWWAQGIRGDCPCGTELAVLGLGMAPGVIDLGRAEAVAGAIAIHLPEEHLDQPVPGHLGEFVHRGDQEGGELAVDLLIDHQDRDALVRGLLSAERTLTKFITLAQPIGRNQSWDRGHAISFRSDHPERTAKGPATHHLQVI